MRSGTATGTGGPGGKSSQDGSGDGNDGGERWREGRTGGERAHRKLESWEKAKDGVGARSSQRAQAPGLPVALPFGRAIGGAFLPANTYPGERGASCSLSRGVRVEPSSRGRRCHRQSFYIHTKTRVPRWWPPCGPLGAGSAAAAAAAAAAAVRGWLIRSGFSGPVEIHRACDKGLR